MSEKMKNLAVRTLSGIVLAAIMLGAVCWSQWSFGALLLVILLCGMHEFYTLAAARGAQPQRLIGMLTGVILFAANFAVVSETVFDLFSANLIPMLGFGLLLLFLVFIRELFREGSDPMANIGATLTGVAYVALPVSLMCYIPMQGEESWWAWPSGGTASASGFRPRSRGRDFSAAWPVPWSWGLSAPGCSTEAMRPGSGWHLSPP